MNNSEGVGLRERKRVQTSDAIHTAAAELVLERGFDETTIEAISDRADVSTRTFFNYFASKEDALLGIDEPAVAAELEKERAPSSDALSSVFELLAAVFEASGGKNKKTELRREVLRRHPQLITRQMVRVAELEDRLSVIIAKALVSDERFANDSEDERLEQARILLGICLATLRVSMKDWANEKDADPGGGAAGAASLDPRKTYERAIATLRTVLDKVK